MAARPAPAKKAPAKKTAVKSPAVAAREAEPAVLASEAKPAAAPVVTLKTVFEQLGEAHCLSKTQTQALLANFVATVTTHLKEGARLRMSGLGILEVKSRAARMGRNPATGEPIQIKAGRKIRFRPAKELKNAG
jgi:DNA-binding protein HU-beta